MYINKAKLLCTFQFVSGTQLFSDIQLESNFSTKPKFIFDSEHQTTMQFFIAISLYFITVPFAATSPVEKRYAPCCRSGCPVVSPWKPFSEQQKYSNHLMVQPEYDRIAKLYFV